MARKVSELKWKTVADAVKELGEEDTLAYIKKGVADFEYRQERNKNEREAIKRAKKDPKFKDLFKNRIA